MILVLIWLTDMEENDEMEELVISLGAHWWGFQKGLPAVYYGHGHSQYSAQFVHNFITLFINFVFSTCGGALGIGQMSFNNYFLRRGERPPTIVNV
jgi:hypothetical protein